MSHHVTSAREIISQLARVKFADRARPSTTCKSHDRPHASHMINHVAKQIIIAVSLKKIQRGIMATVEVLNPPPMYRIRPYFTIKKVKLPDCMYLLKPVHQLPNLTPSPEVLF